MEFLAHWNFAAEFSGYQAAALIVGLDPNDPELTAIQQSTIRPVYERLRMHYGHALKRHYHDASQIYADDDQALQAYIPFELPSVTLIELSELWQREQEQEWAQESHDFTDWLLDEKRNDFDRQTFSRETLVHWLKANELDSVYQFNKDELQEGAGLTGHWPWGNHTTTLLGHLEAAAKRFWVNYDATDRSTAPTNKDVIDWLVKERNVTQNKAEAIASILRPDDLPTGPR